MTHELGMRNEELGIPNRPPSDIGLGEWVGIQNSKLKTQNSTAGAPL